MAETETLYIPPIYDPTKKPVLGTPLRTNHSLAKGLIGSWLFNEAAGGTVFDTSGFGNDGTLTNMDPEDWVAGIHGSALDFDGVDDHVRLSDTTLLEGASAITLSAWIKSGSMADGGIITKYSGQAGWWTYKMEVGATYLPVFEIRTTSNTIVGGLTALNDNMWHHVACVYNGVDMRIYVDSLLDTTPVAETGAIYTGGSREPFIGVTATDNADPPTAGDRGFYSGQISSVQIYNRALTANEIQRLYLDSFSMYRPEAIYIGDVEVVPTVDVSPYYYTHLLAG